MKKSPGTTLDHPRPPRRGSQQNRRALELARRMLAAAQERREFAALGFG